MDKNIATILKSIAYTENGGKVDVSNPKSGKTGEMKSIFQYTPDTWKAESKQYSGQDNLPMTPENESLVAYHKIGDQLQKGLTPQQIFSSWNAGPGEPNAYSGKFSNGHPSKGVNAKYGVPFDVPGYVNKAMSYYDKFQKSGDATSKIETEQPKQPNQNSGLVQTPQASVNMNMPKSNPGLLGNIKPLV